MMVKDKKEYLYSIVIPVYKESSHFAQSFCTINTIIQSLQISYEFIIVDDGSPDFTWNVIQELSEKYPYLKAIRLSRNFGKESALCAGLEMAKGDVVIVMDGDLQHPPELIPRMLEIWNQSNHINIVEAVKVSRGKESLVTKLGSRIFYSALQSMSGYNLRGASDYKLLDRKVVDAWLKMGEYNLFFRGMSAWLGFQRATVSFEVQSRIGGQSGWSTLKLIKLAMTGITAFSSLPLHLITVCGCFFLIFATILGLQTLTLKFIGQAVSGFTTVILILVVMGSLLMISLGIIGLYIARIYDEVKARPRYLVVETINFDY